MLAHLGASQTVLSTPKPWYCSDWIWGSDQYFSWLKPAGCLDIPNVVTPPLMSASQVVAPVTRNQLTNPTAYTPEEYYGMSDSQLQAMQQAVDTVRAAESGGGGSLSADTIVATQSAASNDSSTKLLATVAGVLLIVVLLKRW